MTPPRALAPTALGLSLLAVPWLWRLPQSLWVDEATTAWVIEAGVERIFDRAFLFQGQSPFYYLLEWAVTAVVGRGEIGLRLLSVACTAGSAILTYRIGRRLHSAEAGSWAGALLLASTDVAVAAVNARPYALVLLLCLASVDLLLGFLDGGPRVWLLGYGLATLLVILTHYLYAAVVAAHVMLALWRSRTGPVPVHFGQLFAALVGVALAAWLAVGEQLLFLAQRSESIVWAVTPTLFDPLRAWLPRERAFALIASLALAAMLTRPRLRPRTPSLLLLLAGWYLAPAALSYAASALTGRSIFSTRYLLWGEPAACLLVAVAGVDLGSDRARRVFLGATVALWLAVATLAPRFDEGWRDALAFRDCPCPPGSPVVAWTGFIESRMLDWFFDVEKRSFLTSILDYYHVSGSTYLLPWSANDRGAPAYVAEVARRLARERCVLFVMRFPKESAGRLAVEAFAARGLRFVPCGQHGMVITGRFERGDTAPPPPAAAP